MLPTIEDAKRELKAAAQLNPGPWINHSFNVGIAAGNIAEKISGMDSGMTHSYPLMEKEFGDAPESLEEQEIKHYISSCKCDDYDLLIQLCDSLAVDYGFCILEKRFVDVARRYGVWQNTVERWNITYAIKEQFESRMGCSVYDVLPDIGRTTLLCPPPWKPGAAVQK